MAEVQTKLTIEEFERLAQASEGRLELVHGEVVEMSPDNFLHGELALHIYDLMKSAAQATGGKLVMNVGFILSRDPQIVRGPDIAFVAADRLPPAERRERFVEGAPDLAVEIVSPGDSAADLQAKVEDYLAHGARRVWVLYPRTQQVAVHDPSGTSRRLSEDAVLSGEDVLPGLELAVQQLFQV